MPVTLTEVAAQEIRRRVAQAGRPEATMLRIAVVGGGCSGMEYHLDFTASADEEADLVTESHGVAIVVDKKSAGYLNGTVVDFQGNLLSQTFVFNNPMAVRSCGCGTSFQV